MLREEHVQRSGGEDMTHLRKWEQVGVIEMAVRSWIIKGLIKREKELGILPVACNIYKRGNSQCYGIIGIKLMSFLFYSFAFYNNIIFLQLKILINCIITG